MAFYVINDCQILNLPDNIFILNKNISLSCTKNIYYYYLKSFENNTV